MTKTDRRTFLTKAGILSLTAFSGVALLQACGGSPEEASSDSPSPKPAPAPAPAASEAATEAATADCDQYNSDLAESDLSVRESVGYVAESPEADKICKNCRFYQPDKFEGACGGCQLFVNGAVAPGGYCKSWAAAEA
jgi:hypothetical protein